VTESCNIYLLQSGFEKDSGTSVKSGTCSENIINNHISSALIQARSGFKSKGIFDVCHTSLSTETSLSTSITGPDKDWLDLQTYIKTRRKSFRNPNALVVATLAQATTMQGHRHQNRVFQVIEKVGITEDKRRQITQKRTIAMIFYVMDETPTNSSRKKQGPPLSERGLQIPAVRTVASDHVYTGGRQTATVTKWATYPVDVSGAQFTNSPKRTALDRFPASGAIPRHQYLEQGLARLKNKLGETHTFGLR